MGDKWDWRIGEKREGIKKHKLLVIRTVMDIKYI